MKIAKPMPSWLSYSSITDSQPLPSVAVQMANMPLLKITEQVEAVCIVIAEQQSGNPLGLFQHPENNIETQLCFIQCDKRYHKKVLALLEAMYESCNSPMHLHFEIYTDQHLSSELEQFIKQHQLPFAVGGIIDDDRGTPTCLITPLRQNEPCARKQNSQQATK
jgi:hypothetical protein